DGELRAFFFAVSSKGVSEHRFFAACAEVGAREDARRTSARRDIVEEDEGLDPRHTLAVRTGEIGVPVQTLQAPRALIRRRYQELVLLIEDPRLGQGRDRISGFRRYDAFGELRNVQELREASNLLKGRKRLDRCRYPRSRDSEAA